MGVDEQGREPLTASLMNQSMGQMRLADTSRAAILNVDFARVILPNLLRQERTKSPFYANKTGFQHC